MPKPGEKNAPTFDQEKPEELGRFFERIEDWFADEGIQGDADKKRRIVKYLDPDSESQWKALTQFSDGTFTNFKKAVMASYPRAEEVLIDCPGFGPGPQRTQVRTWTGPKIRGQGQLMTDRTYFGRSRSACWLDRTSGSNRVRT